MRTFAATGSEATPDNPSSPPIPVRPQLVECIVCLALVLTPFGLEAVAPVWVIDWSALWVLVRTVAIVRFPPKLGIFCDSTDVNAAVV